MKAIVIVVENFTCEAHLNIPDGLDEYAFSAAHRRPLQHWENPD
jgi:hypothetical protein